MCIDFRKVNDVTRKDAFPLPRMDDCLDALAGSKLFSTLDLASGYWQIQVAEEDRDKTAFNTRNGLHRFRVMPFGLAMAPATFERLMELVLKGLTFDRCLVYLDGVNLVRPNLRGGPPKLGPRIRTNRAGQPAAQAVQVSAVQDQRRFPGTFNIRGWHKLRYEKDIRSAELGGTQFRERSEVLRGIRVRELLAVVQYTNHFRHLLLGNKFILRQPRMKTKISLSSPPGNCPDSRARKGRRRNMWTRRLVVLCVL